MEDQMNGCIYEIASPVELGAGGRASPSPLPAAGSSSVPSGATPAPAGDSPTFPTTRSCSTAASGSVPTGTSAGAGKPCR